MRLHSDFHPEKGYLCALALLFSKQPPQLNYPPDSVPSKVCIWIRLETYIAKRGISLMYQYKYWYSLLC